ncbi:MAG: hypothetical protein ACLTVE_00900 [Clostridia bacterium]
MKKIFLIIISTILISLIGLGVIGYYVEKDEAAQAQKNKTEGTIVKEEDKEESKLYLDVDKLDINKIEGYTPAKSNEEGLVANMTLPYSIPNKNLDILSIGQYEGKFVEDGSDDKKDNVLAIVVKNTSDKTISSGEIKLRKIGTSKSIKFIFTNLKAGSSALVMESTGEVNFNGEDKYVYISSSVNTEESTSLMEDKIEVTTKDKNITVKNLTNKNLNTVYVYYKIVTDGNCYLGGITYRAKFENVKGEKSVTADTLHFSNKNSEIIKIEQIKEIISVECFNYENKCT